MTKPVVLIVDDDDAHRSMLCALLKGWGYDTDEANDGSVAITKVKERVYDMILADLRMEHVDGITALKEILAYNPLIPVLVVTAWSSVETAVEALRLGAYDYFSKPLDFDVLRQTISKTLERTKAPSESRELRLHPGLVSNSNILGNSQCIIDLMLMVQTVGPSDATVLIVGESGTGKELVARAIRNISRRSKGPFVTVNCAALNPSLLESELFGHEKGAFTGADKSREGRFKQADGGTLFLDEIGELPFALQAKLLRAIQQGEIQKVGSDMPITVDVRVIAATNRDLLEEVEAGHFREDLYYRLNVIGLEVPPLRKRLKDIPILAASFLEYFRSVNKKYIKGFTPQSMDMLLKYNWPGNVRELENAIERAVILATGEYITEQELPVAVCSGVQAGDQGGSVFFDQEFFLQKKGIRPLGLLESVTLEELERRAIIGTLKETLDNKSEAARRLGITRATLHNKLKRYKIEE